MPNWCSNDLRITGDLKELKRFKQFAEGTFEGQKELLSADKFIPYPKEYKEKDEKATEQDKLREDYIAKHGRTDKAKEEAWEKYPSLSTGFNDGGYAWCIKNWGTQWGFCHTELLEEADFKDGNGELFYSFDTAWSPALPVIKTMGKMFPLLTFDLRYFEQGEGFNGMLRIEKGKVTHDKTGEYFGDRGG